MAPGLSRGGLPGGAGWPSSGIVEFDGRDLAQLRETEMTKVRAQADEPTGNLDEDTRDEIIALLETMWRERGLTMVLVTHHSSIARRAQRIGVMKNGRLSFKQSRPRQAARFQAGRAGPGRSGSGRSGPARPS